jgi:hypothetical protein
MKDRFAKVLYIFSLLLGLLSVGSGIVSIFVPLGLDPVRVLLFGIALSLIGYTIRYILTGKTSLLP